MDMDPYERRLQDRIEELDDELVELQTAAARAQAQRDAFRDALDEYQKLQPAASTPAADVLPDASDRLQAIIAILREQPEQLMKAGALREAVSECLGYDLSRHHVADLLRACPERFRSPRRGYWTLLA
jgi:molecular chaperone GrpE (heat shock protein)